MKSGLALASAFSAILLGGCATPANETLQRALTDADPIPKVSVAADRCLESFRVRRSMQGAFFRELIC